MTAVFPPNGRGQINLPALMSANGTGPLVPPPCSTDLPGLSANERMCQVQGGYEALSAPVMDVVRLFKKNLM